MWVEESCKGAWSNIDQDDACKNIYKPDAEVAFLGWDKRILGVPIGFSPDSVSIKPPEENVLLQGNYKSNINSMNREGVCKFDEPRRCLYILAVMWQIGYENTINILTRHNCICISISIPCIISIYFIFEKWWRNYTVYHYKVRYDFHVDFEF